LLGREQFQSRRLDVFIIDQNVLGAHATSSEA
jgi:hypothetical protein